MKNQVSINIPSDEPMFLELQSIILALAATLLNDSQWDEFSERRTRFLKTLFAELIERNPHVLDETPELQKFLE